MVAGLTENSERGTHRRSERIIELLSGKLCFDAKQRPARMATRRDLPSLLLRTLDQANWQPARLAAAQALAIGGGSCRC